MLPPPEGPTEPSASWQNAVSTLLDRLDAYQRWRDYLSAGLTDRAIAERLDLELRELVDPSP